MLGLAVASGTLLVSAGSARGQGAAIDDDAPAPAPAGAAADLTVGPPAQLGVGLRIRSVRMPQSLVELFVESTEGSQSHLGLGVEFNRRRGDFEFAIGLEFESLAMNNGIWVDKGDSIPVDEADLVEFDGLGWVGLDASFLWHQRLHDKVSLRYGAGLGLAYVYGDVLRTDYRCTTDQVESCSLRTNPPAEQNRTPEDGIPPVFPIVNVSVGLQVMPVDKVLITFEAGIRTIPFFGTTLGYLF